jgi:hypothetical protein
MRCAEIHVESGIKGRSGKEGAAASVGKITCKSGSYRKGFNLFGITCSQ